MLVVAVAGPSYATPGEDAAALLAYSVFVFSVATAPSGPVRRVVAKAVLGYDSGGVLFAERWGEGGQLNVHVFSPLMGAFFERNKCRL